VSYPQVSFCVRTIRVNCSWLRVGV